MLPDEIISLIISYLDPYIIEKYRREKSLLEYLPSMTEVIAGRFSHPPLKEIPLQWNRLTVQQNRYGVLIGNWHFVFITNEEKIINHGDTLEHDRSFLYKNVILTKQDEDVDYELLFGNDFDISILDKLYDENFIIENDTIFIVKKDSLYLYENGKLTYITRYEGRIRKIPLPKIKYTTDGYYVIVWDGNYIYHKEKGVIISLYIRNNDIWVAKKDDYTAVTIAQDDSIMYRIYNSRLFNFEKVIDVPFINNIFVDENRYIWFVSRHNNIKCYDLLEESIIHDFKFDFIIEYVNYKLGFVVTKDQLIKY